MNDRWAPWWVYLIAIAGANYARQLIVPSGETAVDVALFAAVAVVVAVVVTVAHRAIRAGRSTRATKGR